MSRRRSAKRFDCVPTTPKRTTISAWCLIQAGDDPNGIAALREAVRLAPDYADAHANLGAALTPTDPDEAIRELEKAVALAPASVKAQFNLATAYGSSSRTARRRRSRRCERSSISRRRLRRARFALGKALLQRRQRDGSGRRRCRRRRGWSRRAVRRIISWASRWRATAGRTKRPPSSRRDASSRPPTIARGTRVSISPKDAPHSIAGELDAAAAKFRHAVQLQPGSPDVQQYLGAVAREAGEHGRGDRRLSQGAGTESRRRGRERTSRRADRAEASSEDASARGRARRLHPGRPVRRRSNRCSPNTSRNGRRPRGDGTRSATAGSASRRSASRSGRSRNRSSSTSATPRRTRSSAAT